MAAVTVNSSFDNVAGATRQRIYNIDIASSGDTLAAAFGAIKAVTFNDVAITKAAVSGTTITFTTTGAVTGALVTVTAR
jgi:hypothetical protein